MTNTRRAFTERIKALLDSEHALSNKEIAKKLGYEKQPNIVAMFKSGTMKVPLSKVPALAEILGADERHLMRLALQEYSPEVLAAIDETMGPADRDERGLLKAHRAETKGRETRLPDAFFESYRALLRQHLAS